MAIESIDRGDGPAFPSRDELEIQTLGPCRHPSPISPDQEPFVNEADRILICTDMGDLEPMLKSGRPLPSFEPAGPRSRIFFDPGQLTCGIVTCGGLCPGINNVIRSIVFRLTYAYGVKRILGFRYGYAGLASDPPEPPISLSPAVVERFHEHGGTFLGSSRGPQDLGEMAATLEREGVGILFVIGGDGGLRGASELSRELTRRGQPIAVIGVPKTIDNDLSWTWRTFGFDTAVEAASSAILAAHVEAHGAWNGIGLVRLMGRLSGFITAHATLATSDVNFCLLPEVPFSLEGKGGFLETLARRLAEKRHAVIAVAEGAGQDFFDAPGAPKHDASGNVILKDIGLLLKDRISRYFAERHTAVTIRYIDPSYMIRSLPANSFDAEYCLVLGQHAVHAGMAGRTNMLVGSWNQRLTHVPIALAVGSRRRVDPRGELWHRVLEATGQPSSLRAR